MDSVQRRRDAWLTTIGEISGLADQLDMAAYAAFAAHFDALDGDSRVFFTGQGRSGLVAHMVAMRFMHMNLPASVVGEATAPAITAGDTLVVVSGSGKTPVSVNFALVAKAMPATVLLVTHQEESPLQTIADASLVLPVGHTTQFGGTLFEESALVVLDSIVLDQMRRREVPHALMSGRHTNFL